MVVLIQVKLYWLNRLIFMRVVSQLKRLEFKAADTGVVFNRKTIGNVQ